jgi:hypothetical protein
MKRMRRGEGVELVTREQTLFFLVFTLPYPLKVEVEKEKANEGE